MPGGAQGAGVGTRWTGLESWSHHSTGAWLGPWVHEESGGWDEGCCVEDHLEGCVQDPAVSMNTRVPLAPQVAGPFTTSLPFGYR